MPFCKHYKKLVLFPCFLLILALLVPRPSLSARFGNFLFDQDASQDTSFILAGTGGMFFSQQEQSYMPKTSCGAAATMMLLLYQVNQGKIDQGIIPPYQELCEILGLNSEPENIGYSTGKGGIRQEYIQQFFSKNNLRYRAFFEPSTIQKVLYNGPIAALIKTGKKGFAHWIVLVGHTNKGLYYLDPYQTGQSARSPRFMEAEKFYSQWETRIAIQLIV